MTTSNRFIAIMRRRMAGLGMDEAALAKAVRVSGATISRWLDGSDIKFEHVVRICSALRITPKEVVDALYPEEMAALYSELQNKPQTARDIIASLPDVQDFAMELLDQDDETLEAIKVLIRKKKGGAAEPKKPRRSAKKN